MVAKSRTKRGTECVYEHMQQSAIQLHRVFKCLTRKAEKEVNYPRRDTKRGMESGTSPTVEGEDDKQLLCPFDPTILAFRCVIPMVDGRVVQVSEPIRFLSLQQPILTLLPEITPAGN